MSEKWTIGGNGTVIFPTVPPGQYHKLINGHTPQMARRIVDAVNNHKRLVKALGDCVNPPSGTLSGEAFDKARIILAEIKKGSP